MNKRKVVFVLGNGFSCGLGFLTFDELWDLLLEPYADKKNSAVYFLEEAKDKYPLSYFIHNKIKDIELLLSVWACYIDTYRLYHPYVNSFDNTSAHYDSYLRNLCGHLHQFSVEATKRSEFNEFITLLNDLNNQFHISFVTLNYDLIIEQIINRLNKRPKYHGTPSGNEVSLKKLHGSINWFKTVNGPYIYPDGSPLTIIDYKDIKITVADKIVQYPAMISMGTPHIIPPIVSKKYESIFEGLLKETFKDLISATDICIIGYSFRDSDFIIQDMFKALIGHNPNAKYHYISSDKNTCSKVDSLFNQKIITHHQPWDSQIVSTILK